MTLDRGSVSYSCMVLELHVISTNLINKCHSIGNFNSQLHWTCLGYCINGAVNNQTFNCSIYVCYHLISFFLKLSPVIEYSAT